MLYQEPFNHTWFIWFKKDIPLNFPQWFVHWFIDTGINTTVFPEYAVKAFEVFTNENTFPKHMQLISFCASFGINWITSWSYGTEKLWDDCNITEVVRELRIRWWNKFNLELLSRDRLNEWFRKNPNYLAKTKHEDNEALFLSKKSKIMAELSSSTNKKEFLIKLWMAMTTSGDDKSDNDSVV